MCFLVLVSFKDVFSQKLPSKFDFTIFVFKGKFRDSRAVDCSERLTNIIDK